MLECGMLKRDRKALQRCSAVLCKQMVVDEVLIQSLHAEDILTDSMVETVMAEPTPQKRCSRLLLLLPKRGPRAFSSLCSALRDTEQQHLCDLLTQSPLTDLSEAQGERLSSEGKSVQQTEQEVPKVSPAQQRDEISSTTFSSQEQKASGNGGSAQVREESRMKKKERQSPVRTSLPLPTQEVIPAKRPRTLECMEVSLDTDSPISTPVYPCSHEFYLSHFEQSYKMTSSPRGFALVISNVMFDPLAAPDLDLRKGGEVDDEVLRKVLTELDYSVTVQRNLTAQDMKLCIESFSRRQQHRTVDSCVLCLLSHGVEGAVYGTDGQLLQLDWVFESFDNAHCPQLQNKPKMFFIQACRGEEMDCGVEQIDGPSRTCSPSCEQLDAGREGQAQANLRASDDLGRPRIKLPQRSDMICGFASLKGTAAMRNTKRGSWFVQDLNTVLRLRAKDTHLADMLVEVNSRIKQREGHAPGTAHHRCKEMSEFTSSLCKPLYFFPKHSQASHF